MDVQVKHRLTGFGVGVDDGPETCAVDLALLGHPCCNHEQMPEKLTIGPEIIVQRSDVLSRNHQDVDRRLRMYVLKCKAALVFVHNLGRNFASGNPAKKAFVHADSLSLHPTRGQDLASPRDEG